ncbi:hypothetical protein F5Y05DRAFT_54212 [Hypoxylon sp. FL0543]|nr:hypothetical protein F5Y05DRAFT_54212 [Hypoxylon sp. FL0543]
MRMRWAAEKENSPPEGIPYCLDIFEVNTSVLYGAGTNAFLRLQEESAGGRMSYLYSRGPDSQTMPLLYSTRIAVCLLRTPVSCRL